jgi:hypothetical protein
VSIHSYNKLGMSIYRVGRKLLFRKTEVLGFNVRFKEQPACLAPQIIRRQTSILNVYRRLRRLFLFVHSRQIQSE